MQVPEDEVRDLLAAISEALDPPWPAVDAAASVHRNRVLADRAAYITGVLDRVISGKKPRPTGEARLIREYAARPLPYQPEGGES